MISIVTAIEFNVVEDTTKYWDIKKWDGLQLEYFNIELIELDNEKVRVCMYPKVELGVNDPIIQDNTVELKKNNQLYGYLEPADFERETSQGKIVKMCWDMDGALQDYAKIGSTSGVITYEENNTVVLESDSGNITATFKKNINGYYNSTVNNYLVAYYDQDRYIFKANDTYEEDNESWNQYQLDISSELPLTFEHNKYGFVDNKERIIINIEDICSGVNTATNQTAECDFTTSTTQTYIGTDQQGTELYKTNYHYIGTFWSYPYIDPSYTLEVIEADVMTNNITFEGNNLTHLNISGNSPYDNLVHYWSFDIDSASTSYDLTNNNLDGVYEGGAYSNTSDCIYGKCLHTPSNPDWIDLPAMTALTNYSLVYWAKADTIHSGYVFITHDATVAGFGSRFRSNEDIECYTGNSARVHWLTTISVDTWYHVACTFDGTSTRIYVDGVLRNTVATSAPDPTKFATPLIGAYGEGPAQPFDGVIDEVMIFNQPLSLTEIQNIRNNNSDRFKQTGTQTHKLVNVTPNNNFINLYLDNYTELLESNITARVGYWDISKGYNEADFDGFNGLVSYWHLDLNGTDSFGTNHLTEQGGLVNSTGKFNSSYNLDGSNDYLDLTTNVDLDTGDPADEYTIIMWINTDELIDPAVGYGNQIFKGITEGGGYGRNTVFIDDYRLKYREEINDGGSIQTGPLVSQDTWTMVGQRWDSTTGSCLIVDSTLSCSSSLNGMKDLYGFGGHSTLGAHETRFDGDIDEIMLFNRSLSNDELKELYIQGRLNLNYTDYSYLGDVLNIDLASTYILPIYRMNASNSTQFYTPYIIGGANFSSDATPDSGPPTIDLIYPTNTSYLSNITDITYSVVDDISVHYCWYSLNDGANTTLTSCNNYTGGLNNVFGVNNLTVYANDTVGNIASAMVSYNYIDVTASILYLSHNISDWGFIYPSDICWNLYNGTQKCLSEVSGDVYVDETGDTMTGDLIINADLTVQNDTYINGTLQMSSTNPELIIDNINAPDDWRLTVDSAQDLFLFSDALGLNRVLYLDKDQIKAYLDYHLLPDTNNARDLGDSTHKWRNANFSGNIIADGTVCDSNGCIGDSPIRTTIDITGVNFTGSDGDQNRQYNIFSPFQVIVDGSVFRNNTDYTYNVTTGNITMIWWLYDEQNVTIWA